MPWGNGGAGPAGIGKRAIERAIEPPARPYEPTGREGMSKDWICAGPDGTARHLRRPVVNPDGTTGKVVTWPTGTKTKRLAPPAPPVQRSQKKAGGGKVESDKGTAPATAVVGDQEGAAEERARILAGLPEDLINPCDAVLRGGRAIRLATLAALADAEAWKNADTDLRLDVKTRLESYVHAQLFERFLGRYDKRPEDWVDPLRVQADEADEEVVLSDVDADVDADAVLDGLAWKNTLSIFASRAKTGKTTLIVDRLAAAFDAGRVPKLALIYSEMSSARMRRFCNLRGFQPEWLARVKVSKIKNVQKCVKRIKDLGPDFVLVDSLTPLVVASGGRPGSLWDPIVSRTVLQPLADTEACVLATHHTRKEDGALRDSGDSRPPCSAGPPSGEAGPPTAPKPCCSSPAA